MNGWQWHAEFANEQAAMAEDFARGFQAQAAKQWRKADEWRQRATGLYLDQPDDVQAWTESQDDETEEPA